MDAEITPPPTRPLWCPSCGKRHVDEGEWATRQHRTHRCVDDGAGKGCGVEWNMADRDGHVLYAFGAPKEN